MVYKLTFVLFSSAFSINAIISISNIFIKNPPIRLFIIHKQLF